MLYGNKKPWTLRDFRITDCIVQMNNAGSNGVINLYGATGTIKDMTIKNSTFYNLVKNSSAYFIRYQNNSQPWKYFGKSDNTSTHIISNNTFCKTFSNKDFGNNIPNDKTSMTQKLNTIYSMMYIVYISIFKVIIRNQLLAILFGELMVELLMAMIQEDEKMIMVIRLLHLKTLRS